MNFLVKEDLSLSNIRDRISEEDIFKSIFSHFKKVNISFSCRKEKYPSARITSYRGVLYFRDFGDPTQSKAETWYQYLKRTMFTEDIAGFKQALQWCNTTHSLGLSDEVSSNYNPNPKVNIVLPTTESELHTKIEVRRRPFNSNDKDYWSQYGIPLSKLEEKGIAALEAFWVTNFKTGGVRQFYNCAKTLSYVYPYYRGKHGEFMYKIYQPLNKIFKWISNVDRTVVQNYPFIPKQGGDLLIPQSSWKDTMVMEIMGYYSISPNTEGEWFPEEYWEKEAVKWCNILNFANNDYPKLPNPGLSYAERQLKKYGINYIFIPNEYEVSDISDFVKNYGMDKAKKLTAKLIKDGIKI